MLGTETTERERDGNGEDDDDDAEDAAGGGAGPQAQAMEEQRERDRQGDRKDSRGRPACAAEGAGGLDDGNASAFANKVVQTRMAFARCLEGAKTPLVPTTANTLHVDCSTLATLLLARAGTGPPQPPAAVNGRVLDLRAAMAAAAAASSQTAGTFKEKAFGYRGVARRKRRWEAHVWRHGRQAYLGGYRDEIEAARAYDMAVLKIRGKEADTNFPRDNYLEELREMRASEMSVEDFIVRMRDRAKRRFKALKEEEQERRAKFLAGLVKRQANASASAAN
eukprot:CAMPEP_0198461206 /NCGR_PEP_ID=MMETSP1456-20131121/4_1 /TAXON_ID=1461544 ORGANISM="Unidentified sp., Strain RCC1871" /NCGR_SAMPLE_ID=MMETSP1456 /ASSEMBLY_ACC=CAM_ASM_001119 /LENGTH=279 /DNA_ID=CAMNT_0044186215 /DNA_START=33 /DNA_END=870 /DNA_ORIENTATION=-